MIRSILKATPVFQQQTRNTWILKRRIKPYLKKSWVNPLVVGPAIKKINPDYALRDDEDYLYEEVENRQHQKEEELPVILLDRVKGLGTAGDIVSVRPGRLRWDLILNHKATYASPRNLQVYKDVIEQREQDETAPSSLTAANAVEKLNKFHLAVIMNHKEPWAIEKWHIRASFRKAGWWVPEDTIELPNEPITGPDIDGKESRDFAVFVTINNKERVPVRCVIHHWTVPNSRYWRRRERKAILESQKELLDSMYKYEPVKEVEEYE